MEEQAVAGKIWPDGSFGYSFRKLKPLRELGLSGAANFRKKPRAPRGARGISGKQRCRIRSGAALLELKYGQKNLSFATLTLPALQGEDRKIAQDCWAKACDRFFEELSRLFKRRGASLIYVGCYEIQEKRSAREHWAVPHLHFLFVGRKDNRWLITPQELRHLWQRAWRNRLSRRYCWTACENLQRIRKSAVAYLAKYLSKGSQVLSSDSESEGAWHPSTWVVANRLMKRWISRSSISIRTIYPLVKDLKSLRDNFTRSGIRPIRRVPAGAGFEIVVGAAGWIDFREWSEFREKFFPESFIPPPGIP